MFVVEKPALLHSVEIKNSKQTSLAQMLLDIYPNLSEVSQKPEDAGLIHRLDYESSGLLLGAKSKDIWLKLRAELKAERIKKEYLILVEGLFRKKLEINNFIGSRHRGSKKVTVTKTKVARSLPAQTNFETLKLLREPKASLVKASAANARRHQVRAHAGYLGFPLLGDALYGSVRRLAELEFFRSKAEITPFVLHATSLAFRHPITCGFLDFNSPLPYHL